MQQSDVGSPAAPAQLSGVLDGDVVDAAPDVAKESVVVIQIVDVTSIADVQMQRVSVRSDALAGSLLELQRSAVLVRTSNQTCPSTT